MIRFLTLPAVSVAIMAMLSLAFWLRWDSPIWGAF